ncbi:MAG: hypothetical protein ACYC4B_32110, partial [Pirellulaceae bacterium]
ATEGGPAGLLFFSHYDIRAKNNCSVSLADTQADVRVAPELVLLTRAESVHTRESCNAPVDVIAQSRRIATIR